MADRDGDESPSHSITLSTGELRAVVRLLRKLAPERYQQLPQMGSPTTDSVFIDDRNRRQLIAEARKTVIDRKRRAQLFPKQMFGEAAWDLLLGLYIFDAEGPRFTVSNILNFADVPPTTGLRWLCYLEQEGLVTRREHPTDGRSALIDLTAKAREALDKYFSN